MVIVTFNPSPVFLCLIDKCKRIAFKVIVIDNGSEDFPLKSGDLDLDILILDCNKGIGCGLNVGIQQALEYHPEWIITFDQDSIPAENILEAYNEVLNDYENHNSVGLMSGGFMLQSNSICFPINYRNSIALITSGMLHNVEVFRKVGFYEEKLFIDNVDFDFVMRVHKTGYATIQIQNNIIKHKIGDPLSKKILGIKITSSNHNETRRYYQARNLVYITRKYLLSYPCQIVNFNYYYYFKILPKMCLVERPLWNKLKSTLKGLRDGLFFQ